MVYTAVTHTHTHPAALRESLHLTKATNTRCRSPVTFSKVCDDDCGTNNLPGAQSIPQHVPDRVPTSRNHRSDPRLLLHACRRSPYSRLKATCSLCPLVDHRKKTRRIRRPTKALPTIQMAALYTKRMLHPELVLVARPPVLAAFSSIAAVNGCCCCAKRSAR